MLDRLRQLFSHDLSREPEEGPDRFHLAAATLLVWAGNVDGMLDQAERARILWLCRHRFGLQDKDALALMTAAEHQARQSVEISRFTRTVRDGFTYDERVHLMEMLWQVVCADDIVHDHEANLMRRLAGLLHVDDRDSAKARARARMCVRTDEVTEPR